MKQGTGKHMQQNNTENEVQEEVAVQAKPKKKKSTLVIIICAIILLAIAVSVFVVATKNAREEEQRQNQEKLNAIMTSETFVDGISVGGVDISGLTVEAAKQKLENENAEVVGDVTIVAKYAADDYEKKLTKENMGITADLDAVLNEALEAAHAATYEEAEQIIADIKQNGKNYDIAIKADDEKLKAIAEEISDDVDVKAKSATIKLGDSGIEYVKEQEGKTLDEDAFVETIKERIENKDFSEVNIELKTSQPKLTVEDIKGKYVKLGSCTTSYSGSTSNRKFNVKRAAQRINGVVVNPGETFSMNGTIGDRTYKNGWKSAAAIVRGSTEQQAGGGVCQVSTTLYNAVVKSDLKIVHRQNHSSKVHYVDPGLDATINTGSIDFTWKDNKDKPVMIKASADGSKLTVSIYGPAFDTSEYDEIKLSSSYVGTSSSGKMTYQSYKNYYKDGKKVKSEKLDRSTYRPYN